MPRLIDANELIKDLEDWKDGVSSNPYIDKDVKVQILTDIEEAIDYTCEQEIIGCKRKYSMTYSEAIDHVKAMYLVLAGAMTSKEIEPLGMAINAMQILAKVEEDND